MNATLLAIINWLMCNPRRVVLVLTIVVLTLSLALAAVPNGMVFAEDIVGGS